MPLSAWEQGRETPFYRIGSVLVLTAVLVTASHTPLAPHAPMQAGRPTPEQSLSRPHRVTAPDTAIKSVTRSGEFKVNEVDLSGGLNNQQGEISIAVNRRNPDQAVAVVMNFTENSDQGNLLLGTTHNGGETWVRQTLKTEPLAAYIADPMLAFDGEGRVFLTQLPIQGQTNPLGIDVIRSLDAGLNWESPVRVSSSQGQDDKPAIAADDEPGSAYFGHVYVAWKRPSNVVLFSRSIDHGQSFSTPLPIATIVSAGLDITITRDGTVLVAYNHPHNALDTRGIYVQRSLDGGQSFEAPLKVAPVNAQWQLYPLAHCSNPGTFIQASIDADRSRVDASGRVFLTWTDYPDASPVCSNPCSNNCPTRVRFATSADGGLTWSGAQSLLPVAEMEAGAQFFQWSDIDQSNGDLYVGFKDSSVDVSNRNTHTRMLRSTDQGITWSEPLTLSSDSGFNTTWPGHYQGLAAQNGRVYSGWADYRSNGTGDFYVATATRPDDEIEDLHRAISGPWFNAEQPGHGWFLEVLPGQQRDTPDRLLAYWYVYLDNKPVWLTGIGNFSGRDAVLPVIMTRGGQFPPDFDGAETIDWGSLSFSFESGSSGNVKWHSGLAEFGSGSMAIQQLAAITASDQGCLSGSYFHPDQSGHGFTIEIVPGANPERVVVTWFAYINGEQIWLSGLGEINGNMITAELSSHSQGQFPPNFESSDVVETPWGLISLSFSDNDHARVSWFPSDERFTDGELDVERLSHLKGHRCAVDDSN
jgi:hypothetical protein